MDTRRCMTVAAAAAIVLGVGACGGTSSSSGSGVENRTAQEIADAASAAMDAQAVIHITQTVTMGGRTITEELLLTADAGRATVHDSAGGTSVDLLAGGVGYTNDGTTWAQVPTDQLATSYISKLSVHGQVSCARLARGGLAKGAISTRNGKRVIAIVDDGKAPGGTPNTMYVALDGPPLTLGGTATGPSTEGGRTECGAALPQGVTATAEFDYPAGAAVVTPPPIASTPQR